MNNTAVTCTNMLAAASIMWLGLVAGASNAATMNIDSWSRDGGRHRAVFGNRVGSSFDDSVRFSFSNSSFDRNSSSSVSLKHDRGITLENIELWGDGKLLRSGSDDGSGSHLSFLGDSNTKDYELRFRGFNVSGDGSYCGEIAVSPVPEPQTYAMMLIGLGLVGFSARRRKRDN